MTRFFAAALATAMLTPPAQTPLQQSAATATTGVIRGHIFTADGRPLQRAQVRLLNLTGGGGMLRNVDTDDDGSYQFADVRAGVYMVIASHNGFVTFVYGRQGNYPQTDTGIAAAMAIGPDQVFTLGQGETKEHVDITLPRHGAIVGHIVDENGDPVEGVNVRALKIAFTAGRRQLVGAGSVSPKTNDQGRFRIYGLQPGSYIVSADVGHAGSQDLPGYAATYFPGTLNPGEAQPVTVGVSQEVTNVDFALTPVRTASVSGRTIDADGQPFQGGIEMRVSRRSSAVASDSFGARTERDGTFEFQHIPPGEYVLNGFRGQEIGWQMVEVNGADVAGLTVQTTAGSTISGRVSFEGANPPEQTSVGIAFVPADPDLVPFKGQPPQTDVRRDGTFEIKYANGLGRLRALGVPAGWAMKSVIANGVDVADTPLPFGTREQSLKDVDVTLTNQVTTVDGTVTDAAGRSVTSGAALIFSSDRDRWYEGSRFFSLWRLRPGGLFTVQGMPPGDYFIAAIDWLQPGDLVGGWQDPALLESLSRDATRVTLTEGQKVSVSLKLSPR